MKKNKRWKNCFCLFLLLFLGILFSKNDIVHAETRKPDIEMDCYTYYPLDLEKYAGHELRFENQYTLVCQVIDNTRLYSLNDGYSYLRIYDKNSNELLDELLVHVHVFSISIWEQDPTCTEDGQQLLKCYHCEKTYLLTTPKYDHYYKPGVITKKATHLTEGTRTFSCKRCSYSYTEPIPKCNINVTQKGNVITVSTNYPSTIHFSSSNPNIKLYTNISSNRGTASYQIGKFAGIGYIKVSIDETDEYMKFEKSFSLKVNPKYPNFSLKSPKKKQLKISLGKGVYKDYYQLQITKDKSFKKGIKTYTVKADTKTIKKLQSKKTYYVRVRSSLNHNYSVWSPIKKIRLK